MTTPAANVSSRDDVPLRSPIVVDPTTTANVFADEDAATAIEKAKLDGDGAWYHGLSLTKHILPFAFFASLGALAFIVALVMGIHSLTSDEAATDRRTGAYGSTATEVPQLPGLLQPLPSKLYSGYITVDPVADRRLFFLFIESYKDPKVDPLVLWLNGGPGCSSLAGLFEEHGPVSMDFTRPGTGLLQNPYTWANNASVIYLESPAGVGFSFSNRTSDYTTVGDARTSNDTLTFLRAFIGELFPEFKLNPLWITGESYAGHYVPQAAYAVDVFNALQPTEETKLNLKGFMVGNAWTAPPIEGLAIPLNWWERGVIPKAVHTNITQYCTSTDVAYWITHGAMLMLGAGGGRGVPTLQQERWRQTSFKQQLLSEMTRGVLRQNPSSPECHSAMAEATSAFSGVSIYDVFSDVCNAGTNGALPTQPNYCSEGELKTYLNTQSVQAALHVITADGKEVGTDAGDVNTTIAWHGCSPVVQYNFTDVLQSVIPIYQHFIAKNQQYPQSMRMLVFSGDADMIVPFTATRLWLESLALPTEQDVVQWWSNTNGAQVAGWKTVYGANSSLTYATVRGAGHMVPIEQPKRALDLFSRFLAGEPL